MRTQACADRGCAADGSDHVKRCWRRSDDVHDAELEAILDAAVLCPRPPMDKLVTINQLRSLIHEVQERRALCAASARDGSVVVDGVRIAEIADGRGLPPLDEEAEVLAQQVIGLHRSLDASIANHPAMLWLSDYELEGLRQLVRQLERDALPQGSAVEAFRALKRHLAGRT